MRLLSAIISTALNVVAVEKTTLIDGLFVQDTRKTALTSHVLDAEK
jgi:hypothetical protein